MAKQKSIIKIQGSIDDMTFYTRKGKPFVKKKPEGFTKEQINSNPSLGRIKEVNSEFAGAQKIGSALRKCFVELLPLTDGDFYIRCTSLSRSMINLGMGVRGQRPFTPQNNPELFRNLIFQQQSSFDSICYAPYTAEISLTGNSVTVNMADFNTSNLLNPPPGATHFRLMLHASTLSAYEYNVENKKYWPTNPDYNGIHSMTRSAYYPLGGMLGSTISMSVLLENMTELPPDAVFIATIGIQFSQQMNGVQYDLASKNALKIVAVKALPI